MATLNPDISQPYSLNQTESVAEDEENPAKGQKGEEESKKRKSKRNSKKPTSKPNITSKGGEEKEVILSNESNEPSELQVSNRKSKGKGVWARTKENAKKRKEE